MLAVRYEELLVLLVVVLLAVRKVEAEEGGRGAKEDGGDAVDGGR